MRCIYFLLLHFPLPPFLLLHFLLPPSYCQQLWQQVTAAEVASFVTLSPKKLTSNEPSLAPSQLALPCLVPCRALAWRVSRSALLAPFLITGSCWLPKVLQQAAISVCHTPTATTTTRFGPRKCLEMCLQVCLLVSHVVVAALLVPCCCSCCSCCFPCCCTFCCCCFPCCCCCPLLRCSCGMFLLALAAALTGHRFTTLFTTTTSPRPKYAYTVRNCALNFDNKLSALNLLCCHILKGVSWVSLETLFTA